MTINPQVRHIITNYIESVFATSNTASIQELIRNFKGPSSIMESELRLTINHLINEGYLKVVRNKPENTKLLQLSKPTTNPLQDTIATIVISKPRLRELGFLSIGQRNLFLETTDCFRKLIKSSVKILRICSPFLQKDVLLDDSFPDLKKLLYDAMNRGVEIRILTREIHKRSKELEWLLELNADQDKSKLVIVDYHLSKDNNILSSTHAKIICADYESAYVGSAELRRNSIIANFEIGCYLKGPQVHGICEVFDLMIEKGILWR